MINLFSSKLLITKAVCAYAFIYFTANIHILPGTLSQSSFEIDFICAVASIDILLNLSGVDQLGSGTVFMQFNDSSSLCVKVANFFTFKHPKKTYSHAKFTKMDNSFTEK